VWNGVSRSWYQLTKEMEVQREFEYMQKVLNSACSAGEKEKKSGSRIRKKKGVFGGGDVRGGKIKGTAM